VGEIAQHLPVTRPAVSDAELVGDRSEGTRRIYYIDPKGLGAMRAWLDQFWEAALAAFAAEMERSERKQDE
jgi:hypothetical protein